MEVDNITVYLDSIDGNDATGVLNDINHPYKTLNAGYYAARASSTVLPVDLIAIKGMFTLTRNPTVAYYLMNLSDPNDASMVTIDQKASFTNCIFDINMLITLTTETGTGITINGFFLSASGRSITVTGQQTSSPSFITTIFNGMPSSFTIILSNVNINTGTSNSRLIQYINTTGNLITTYPNVSLGNISYGPGQLFIIEIEIAIGGPSPTVAVIDNSYRTDGNTSTVTWNFYSSQGELCRINPPFDIINVGSKTGIIGPTVFSQSIVNNQGTDLGRPNCVDLPKVPSKSLQSSPEIFPFNYTVALFGGIADPSIKRQVVDMEELKRLFKYLPTLQQLTAPSFDRSLMIDSSFFTLEILQVGTTTSPITSYVTNTNSFSIVQTNFNNIDIPPTSTMTVVVPDIDPLYAVNNNSMAYNNNGAIIYNPVRVTSAYTPPKYFGTLFYVDGSNESFDITLNTLDVSGRMLIFKRIDSSSHRVRILSSGGFDGVYKYISLLPPKSDKLKCKCENKLFVTAITISFDDNGKYFILSSQ